MGERDEYGEDGYPPNRDHDDEEHDALLPEPALTPLHKVAATTHSLSTVRSSLHLLFAFTAGIFVCVATQYLFPSLCYHSNIPANCDSIAAEALAHSYAGSKVAHEYPPPSATNNFPSLFPTDVGYAGPTPTGDEAGLIATAPGYPLHTGAANLLGPSKPPKPKGKSKHGSNFDIFKTWGNLRYVIRQWKDTFSLIDITLALGILYHRKNLVLTRRRMHQKAVP